ncbi:hypothetical protein HDV02_005365 [Globomyces sp. JEL0801]|nr:hypothetical protein HDV02_005365 [Globomyces sp. JEL0801]
MFICLGGSLELYPTKSKGVPCEAPSTVIAPAWNRIVMFPVVPGFSFHSVEEVVGPGKERYSLQGWFHYAQEGEAGYDLGSIPEGLKQNSTLNQLLNAANDKFLVYKNPLPLDSPLSPDDTKVLTEFMNPEYLKLQSIEKIRDTFLDESKVNLQDFLNVETAKKMGLYISKMDNKCHFNPIKMTPHGTGVEEGWEVEGPPHVKRYLVFRPEKVDLNTNIFKVVLDGLKSNSFRKWLSLIGSSVLESYHIIARRFRPGLDYTLATPNKTTYLDINLGLTPTHPVWDDGEHGGYECYMANDATEQDAAVYRVDAKDDVLLTTMANWNILTIALRDEGVLKFVKYVSNQCARSRYDIEGEFPVVYDDE